MKSNSALPRAGQKPESVSRQTIDRLGFENVEAQLLSNDLLERKQEILDAKLHMTAERPVNPKLFEAVPTDENCLFFLT